jgi:hypothetical protein
LGRRGGRSLDASARDRFEVLADGSIDVRVDSHSTISKAQLQTCVTAAAAPALVRSCRPDLGCEVRLDGFSGVDFGIGVGGGVGAESGRDE